MEKWLEKEENLEMWHDGIPAKTRRVLMTKWAGKAWRELSSDEDFVKKLFEKTGCLMTADGEDDEKIRPQGLEPNTFQSTQSCAWTYLDTLQSWTLGIPFETLHSYKS